MPMLEKMLGTLLDEMCLEWGFCLPPADRERIASSRSLTADEFAAEVLRAEGFDPEYELSWYRKVRQRFIDRFGEAASAEDSRFQRASA
jgi:hypothetical protein